MRRAVFWSPPRRRLRRDDPPRAAAAAAAAAAASPAEPCGDHYREPASGGQRRRRRQPVRLLPCWGAPEDPQSAEQVSGGGEWGGGPGSRGPGGPLGRSRGRGDWRDLATTRPALAERPRQLCPGAASSRAPGLPAGPRREFRERRGFACLVRCVYTHTLANACCFTPLSHSRSSFALRGRGDPGDGRGGGGKAWGCGDGVEVVGLALSPAPPGCLRPLAREWGRRNSLSGQEKDPLLLAASVAAATLLAGSRKGRLEAWITPTQSAKMLREGCEKGRRVISKPAKAREGECRSLALLVLESAQ